MNNIMIERFNVAGAQLSKLYGRAASETDSFAAAPRGSPILVSSARLLHAFSFGR
jgi:hypothetical protein